MLKLAVIGAQTMLGRELVGVLEAHECSVLPLSTGPMSRDDEEGDVVAFAPSPELLEEIELAILVDTPDDPVLLESFKGRILDYRENADQRLDPAPLNTSWVKDVKAYRGRAALEQVIALLPRLVEGFTEISGTHLRSVGHLGDRGLNGLMDQTLEILNGNEPDIKKLGYRGAFEAIPQPARGNMVEVLVPVFHGDLVILHLSCKDEGCIRIKEIPEGVKWMASPPSSRDVAVSSELLAHLSIGTDKQNANLILGFDPILWGVLRPTLKLLGLKQD